VHHEIHFGQAWRSTFDEILGGQLQSDPSLLVSTPTISDPELAPDGRAVYYVLVPTPNLDAAGRRSQTGICSSTIARS